jgi:Flp pilus assembly protein TadG
MKHQIKRIWHDESGGILVLWMVCLTLVLGIVAMSFDVGRIASTQTELQSFADNVALAAAGELDGNNDAITRATAAAANMIADSQTFGSGSQALNNTDFTLDFYKSLPGNDQASLTAGITTVARDAIYARVVVTPKTVPFTFGAAFFTLSGNAPSNNQVGAVAVAGFTQYACDITPMMFCIPSPSFDAASPATVGDMILLRSGGQGAAWGPGDFGFLQPSTLALDSTGSCAGINGAGPLLECVLGAAGSITQCFAQRGVDTEPGQKVGITDALNVRFDIYKGNLKNKKTDPLWAPAANVIKGIVPRGGGSCIGQNSDPSPDTVAIPRDDCFNAGTCTRYGNGNWSAGRANYVATNYGGADPAPGATTRFQMYMTEIANGGGPLSTGRILPPGKSETGRRMCSNQQDPDPNRRVIIAAGIDCAANPINGATTGVPVHQFVKLFLTEPITDNGAGAPTLAIFAEIIGKAGGGGAGTNDTAGTFHDVVQLYR